ncbi:TetR/AcrR family transcriptional regulator [Carboxydochorda subterranea]|uniref:TetR/AcrR family transcriptional regulator n=1 Tax=Carboxydichorda subterranea TaxID=3109565 RepID=A0ABZ1BXP7_9FIRM|nr:TetR/AcrR family transcriptional regulator [Limnochorda sp. L945t]WRP17400.1 TetR/AcrR family transcriptional regulator [Limnochorda sp. L945t]
MPRQARSRAKRDAILAAAARLFGERGYEATTASDIAAEAGVSIGTLYSYFRDKRQIFLSLYASALDSLSGLDIAGALLSPDPLETIRALLARVLPYDAAHYALQRAWVGLTVRDPDVARCGEQIHRFLYDKLLAAVRQAQARGLARPDLDAEATCWAVLILVDRVWHTELDPATLPAEEFSRRRDALAHMIFHAIFPDPSSRRAASPLMGAHRDGKGQGGRVT